MKFESQLLEYIEGLTSISHGSLVSKNMLLHDLQQCYYLTLATLDLIKQYFYYYYYLLVLNSIMRS